MRGQPSRLSRNYPRRNGGKCLEESFTFQKTFHSTDVFYTLSHLLIPLDFLLLCARLAVYFSAFHSVFICLGRGHLSLYIKIPIKFPTWIETWQGLKFLCFVAFFDIEIYQRCPHRVSVGGLTSLFHGNIHATPAWAPSAEEMGAMSENNTSGIIGYKADMEDSLSYFDLLLSHSLLGAIWWLRRRPRR